MGPNSGDGKLGQQNWGSKVRVAKTGPQYQGLKIRASKSRLQDQATKSYLIFHFKIAKYARCDMS